MKTSDFNKYYEYAKGVNVVNDDWLNCMGWFWLNCTPRQLRKMYDLMLLQGAEETTDHGKTCIKLKIGTIVYKEVE